jgi:hypothetical protein
MTTVVVRTVISVLSILNRVASHVRLSVLVAVVLMRPGAILHFKQLHLLDLAFRLVHLFLGLMLL